MKKFTTLLLTATIAVAGMNAQDLNLHITGDATGSWNNNPGDDMKLQWNAEKSVYSWTGDLQKDKNFRFLTQNNWYPTYTTTESAHKTVNAGTYPIQYDETARSGEPAFRMEVSGNFTINLDIDKLQMELILNKEIETAPELYIIGDATQAGWTTGLNGLTNNYQKLTLEENGHYTWIGQLSDNGDGCFRFITTDKWWPSYTTVETNKTTAIGEGEYELRFCETGPSPDAAFKIAQTGIYSIDLDLEAMTMKLERKQLYVFGNATETDWNQNNWNHLPLEYGDNNTASWTGNLKHGEFRFNPSRNWWPALTTSNTASDQDISETPLNLSFIYTENKGKSFSVTEEGNYTLVVDFNSMELTVTRNGDVVVEEEMLFICGSALHDVADNNWNTPERIKEMTPTETPNEFTWTGQMYVEGGAQFKFRDHEAGHASWDGYVNDINADLPIESGKTYTMRKSTDAGAGDGKWTINESAEYTVTANTAAKTMTITKKNSSAIEAVEAERLTVTVTGRTATVAGEATVYDALGRTVATVTDGSLTLPAAGIYIIASNGNTAKIAVK